MAPLNAHSTKKEIENKKKEEKYTKPMYACVIIGNENGMFDNLGKI
jgi:hypothetical protein